ncbi:MAG: Rrf2 family transcriptional regulator [Anaerolineales bacterium]|nr:Rrf2 family transcriptional regulator [Anaerolineales bacterium]
MFRINRQTDYAIRVLLALAKQPAGARLATSAIGEEMLIPRAFLNRIVAQLANTGLLKTFAGRDGGLQLDRPAEELNLRQVIEAMEGAILLSECMTGDSACPFEQNCPVRGRWGRLQGIILAELEHTNFAILVDEVRQGVLNPASVLPVSP